MKLGTISLWGDRLQDFVDEVTGAEELGYDVVSIGDSPAGWHELYVSITAAAALTKKVLLSPMVTTPLGRHPMLTANAISSLYEYSGGRAVLALGSGTSMASGFGRKPATLQENRDYIIALKDLFKGKSIIWEGNETTALRYAQNIPIYYSAYGPKALALAGELADGVVITAGCSIADLEAKIATVRNAAAAVGRDPDSVDIWAYSYISVRGDRATAIQDIISFVASTGISHLRNKDFMSKVPPDLVESVLELRRRYDTTDHCHPGGYNAKLIEELGLIDYLASLNSIVGTPEEVKAAVDAIAARGVSCLMCALPGNADRMGTLNRFYNAVASSR